MPIFNDKGILGINARNLLYIRPYNPKKAIKLADDKLKTKQFLSAREIPVPKLYSIIKNNEELDKFDFNALPSSFVIKPNHGYGGEGIIPIVNHKDGYWITASGKKLSKHEIISHIQDILDGRYSISNVSDYAFMEQFIMSEESIGQYSYEGLPDIRVVVHNLIPVMAMLRLPTKESEGKANLHLGAVGVGIDIAKGETTHVTYKNKIIDELPENKGKIKGVKIPYWDEILLIASKVQLVTNLGYMAVDICLDKNSGPVLLEINARAGLGVQLANLAPLRRRLERIEGIKVTTPTKGVRVAKDLFGNLIEKEIKQLSGKQIISTQEEVELIEKKGTYRIKAKIDTGRIRSILDEKTAEQIGYLEDSEAYDDEKSTLKLKFSLKNQRIQTVVDLEPIKSEDFKFIIGSRDLKNFLVDTSINKEKPKTPQKTNIEPSLIKKNNYAEIDQELIEIDSKIKLLYHVRPLNIETEQKKFYEMDGEYNPVFDYPELKFNPIEMIEKLNKIECDSSPVGLLFEEKKKEISLKIALLESIDEEKFTEISIKLFGKPKSEEVIECRNWIKKGIKEENNSNSIYGSEQVKEIFQEVFDKYQLKNWKPKTKKSMVAACIAGKNNRLYLREGINFNEKRIKSLIVHEIETHILTAENGKHQPFELFNRGFANYLETQEGLAMYNVVNQMKIPFSNKSQALAHVIAIDIAQRHGFKEIYKELINLGLTKNNAFRSALKAKRGFCNTAQPGAFTKDYIYYHGYKKIDKFIKSGGDIKDLYLGKFDLKDLEIIKKINGLIQPKYLPEWLNK